MYPIGETQEKCESCAFYLMIDSAYGYCRRYPPSIRRIFKRGFLGGRIQTEDEYPIVAYNNNICGEKR